MTWRRAFAVSVVIGAGALMMCLLSITGGRPAAFSNDVSKPAADKTAAARTAPDGGAIGRRVPNIVLTDPAGKEAGLADFREKSYLALVFISCDCPISNQYLPILNDLAKQYAEKGLQIIAINSHA